MESTSKVKAIYRVTDTHIYGFFEKHRFLSNYHMHSIEYEDIVYPSTENAYQAAKTLNVEERLKIAALTPNQSKSAGRAVSLRADWLNPLPLAIYGTSVAPYPYEEGLIIQVRDKIMYDLNVIKFSNPYLRNLLLETGEKYLEETNWWRDDYWGVFEGNGLNKLGRILMKIRDEIKQQKEGS